MKYLIILQIILISKQIFGQNNCCTYRAQLKDTSAVTNVSNIEVESFVGPLDTSLTPVPDSLWTLYNIKEYGVIIEMLLPDSIRTFVAWGDQVEYSMDDTVWNPFPPNRKSSLYDVGGPFLGKDISNSGGIELPRLLIGNSNLIDSIATFNRLYIRKRVPIINLYPNGDRVINLIYSNSISVNFNKNFDDLLWLSNFYNLNPQCRFNWITEDLLSSTYNESYYSALAGFINQFPSSEIAPFAKAQLLYADAQRKRYNHPDAKSSAEKKNAFLELSAYLPNAALELLIYKLQPLVDAL